MKYKILLIGFGSIGKRHYSLLEKRNDVECVDIVSTYAEIKTARIFTFLEQISHSDLSKYHIFIICTETYKHEKNLKYINNLVQNKVILVEKPLSKSSVDLETNNHNNIFVSYNLRFHPIINKIKKIINNKKILICNAVVGQYLPSWRENKNYLESYSAYLEKGGGVLRDLSHEIDLVKYICGNIKLISALSSSHSNLNLKSDDICTILASNNHSAHIVIQMDYLALTHRRFVFIQTNNLTIKADLISNILEVTDIHKGLTVYNYDWVDRNYTYKSLHDELLNQSTPKSTITTFEDGNHTMKIIDIITDQYMEKSWLKNS
ncbi:Gfo/Idh/MocA family oxidoreductase [Photorhabdus antumapuensis]|uniref:Gfo/Idh/MocA family oxidoreductase n=1 Tax=Photorhabdus antumapuensis TaxID=2862867 RepID=UPI001CED1A86|nr:Gfo/Idh/MocA family oxidoreductase [Photorhabdus antumapuensis]MCA6222237.1 Gfo/Idh/MocA family oxidoreductase [Photorhabdus antumapuensis]